LDYVDGGVHGTFRAWYPNGQLHVECQYANGKLNGRDRGWYESGKPQYEATNVDDEEVEGTFWNEDGTEG
jgi:antitoxin component YwqK of YwqJK toxin-antitoxin module